MKYLAPLLTLASIAGLCQSASAQANIQVTVSGTIATNTGNFADARYNTATPGTPFSLSYELRRIPIGQSSNPVNHALAMAPVTLTMGGTTIASPTPVNIDQSVFLAGFGAGGLGNIGSTVVLQNGVVADYGMIDPTGTVLSSGILIVNGSINSSTWINEYFYLRQDPTNPNSPEIFANGLTLNVFVPDLIGTPYCSIRPNSTGDWGRLIGTGSAVAADNNVTLNIDRLPPGMFGIAIVSQTQGFVDFGMQPGNPNVGILCLGGTIGRYNQLSQIFQSNALGQALLPLDLTLTPQGAAPVAIMAGESWNFQVWYRDFSPTGASIANYTNPMKIDFM